MLISLYMRRLKNGNKPGKNPRFDDDRMTNS